MKLSDGLSLAGLLLVVVLLMHAARHGPIAPVYERMGLLPTAPAVIEPVPAAITDAPRAPEATVAGRTR